MIESVFRITRKQLDLITSQMAGNEDHKFVPVQCGTGSATISQKCKRIVWCAHKILDGNPISNAAEVIERNCCQCVFTNSLESLEQLRASDLRVPLWAFISCGDIQVFTSSDGLLVPVTVSVVVGHDLLFHFSGENPMIEKHGDTTEFFERTMQAFGKGTTQYLSQLTIAVAGVSGTGSIVAEQLFRLGVKRLVLIDDDVVEKRNLGRILNSRVSDAEAAISKVEMLQKTYQEIGLSTDVIAVPTVIAEPSTIQLISVCDVIFGCLDSADGRHHLNRISTFYNIPYIDMGVSLVSDNGKITDINGAVRYIIPGSSSLMSRQAYSMEQLESDALRRTNPEAYEARLKEKYIQGASESSPAVISVNMQVASLSVLELLARLHPYRDTPNAQIETIWVNLFESRFQIEAPSEPDKSLLKLVGTGDCTPLLNMPSIGGKV